MEPNLQPQFTKKEESLIDDCITIWTENDFLSRWHRIEAYHQIGLRIIQEGTPYGEKIVALVANSIGKSTRNVYRAIEFAKMYPNLDLLPEGKNTTWYGIINKYLPAKLAVEKDQNSVYVYICPNCNSKFNKVNMKFIKEER